MTKVITIENYGDIDKSIAEMVNYVNEHLRESPHSNCGSITFYILEKEAIERFWSEHFSGKAFAGPAPKVGKNATVELVPYMRAECHYEVGHKLFFESYVTHNGYDYLVRGLDGTMLNFLRNGRFDLFNDDTNYRLFLPYSWDEQNPEPNKMNVVCDKGVQQWIEWRKKRQAAALFEKTHRMNTVLQFKEEIAKINPSECTEFQDNGNKGHIVRNGLSFSWEIQDGLHIRKNLKVHYSVSTSVDSFMKMCKGEYVENN